MKVGRPCTLAAAGPSRVSDAPVGRPLKVGRPALPCVWCGDRHAGGPEKCNTETGNKVTALTGTGGAPRPPLAAPDERGHVPSGVAPARRWTCVYGCVGLFVGRHYTHTWSCEHWHKEGWSRTPFDEE